MTKGTCSIEGCGSPARTVGWCNKHYLRWWKYGDPRHERPSLEERIWAFVAVADTPDGCWVWRGYSDRRGYGRILTGGRGSRSTGVHRWMYENRVGPIPEGHHVLHHCDNPPCCNPSHLFTGTDADNIRDMDAKGRRVTSLTPAQVRELRARYASERIPQHVLADQYGIRQAQVSKIVRRECWAHIE